MTAQAGHQVFTVSEGYGLWIPAGMLHSGRVTANVVLHDAFFSSALAPPSFRRPTVVAMAPMLQTLLANPGDTRSIDDWTRAVGGGPLRPSHALVRLT